MPSIEEESGNQDSDSEEEEEEMPSTINKPVDMKYSFLQKLNIYLYSIFRCNKCWTSHKTGKRKTIFIQKDIKRAKKQLLKDFDMENMCTNLN